MIFPAIRARRVILVRNVAFPEDLIAVVQLGGSSRRNRRCPSGRGYRPEKNRADKKANTEAAFPSSRVDWFVYHRPHQLSRSAEDDTFLKELRVHLASLRP